MAEEAKIFTKDDKDQLCWKKMLKKARRKFYAGVCVRTFVSDLISLQWPHLYPVPPLVL